MLIYYDHYGRRDGFCFFGNNWPQGIRVDNADLQGTGYLWNIFTNLYGDLGANLNAPRSCFVLRDCFGPLHATVYGIAGVGQDGRRSVTYVDFAVRIPQNREEAEAEFNPRDLLRELQVPHVPGTCVQAPVPPVWQPLPPDEAAMQLGRELAWRPLSVVWAGDTAARTVPELARGLYSVLPAARRRTFSFVSYCANWSTLCRIGGVDLIGTDQTRETLDTVVMMQNSGADVAYLQQGSRELRLPPVRTGAAGSYLRRIYPQLVRDKALDQPAQSARWLRESPFAPDQGEIPLMEAMAVGFILRAAAGGDQQYYPLTEEKQQLTAVIAAATGRK